MKLYGIDFNRYACGGAGNKKLQIIRSHSLLFHTEVEMLKKILELKEDFTVGEIEPYTAFLAFKEEYRL